MISDETMEAMAKVKLRMDELAQSMIDSGIIEALAKAEAYFQNARSVSSDQIDIEPPWNYNPDSYDRDTDTIELALRWFIEAKESLEGCGNPNLEKFAKRMESAENAIVREGDDSEVENMYESVFLLMSLQDGFVQWLCISEDRSPDDTNQNGDPIFFRETKKDVLERHYDSHSVFDVEQSGSDFRQKWESFFEHRHRVMHGHPDAYFDENLSLTALLFTTLTAYVAESRWTYLRLDGDEKFVFQALANNPGSYLREIHQATVDIDDSSFEYSPTFGDGPNDERRTIQSILYELRDKGLARVDGQSWHPD